MTNTRKNDPVKIFWDKYIKHLADIGVKPSVSRWYVIRAEQYIKRFPNKKLLDHSPEDIICYLKEQGGNGKISDWQFCQLVDAIQKLFEIVKKGVKSAVDFTLDKQQGRTCVFAPTEMYGVRRGSDQANRLNIKHFLSKSRCLSGLKWLFQHSKQCRKEFQAPSRQSHH